MAASNIRPVGCKPVLVGIATRNRAEILPKAIQSALAQSYSPIRVGVLDDGSQDATPDLRSKFPQVRWDRWDSPCGYMEARNHLMRTSEAEFYLSLDDDAWFMNGDEVVVAIKYLEANPRVAAVAFDILSPDRTEGVARSLPRPIGTFIGCGHVLRMEAVRETGDYASSPGEYGAEEKDLCLRLLDKGWDVHLLPGVHIWHDKSALARDAVAQHRSRVCNDLAFALRRCPLPWVCGVLPYKLVNNLRFSLRQRLLRPCLAGFALFFCQVGAVWGSREPVRTQTFREFVRRSRKTT